RADGSPRAAKRACGGDAAKWPNRQSLHAPSPGHEGESVEHRAGERKGAVADDAGTRRRTDSGGHSAGQHAGRAQGSSRAAAAPGGLTHQQRVRRHRMGSSTLNRQALLLEVIALPRATYENPIQRPPHATPNHRLKDMSAVKRPSRGRSEVKPDRVTLRRTVNANRSARNRDVIFTQNGKL